MRMFRCAVALGLMLAGGTALAQGAAGTASEQDRAFTRKAMAGSMMEVQLGGIAKDKARSDDVKQFGTRMIDDHGKANQQLETIAGRLGIQAPTDLPADKAKEVERLSKLSGDEFDTAYMQAMVKDHQEDLDAFRKQARQGNDPELKSFAEQTATTIEDHLRQAREISSAQNVAAKPGKK